MDLSKGTRSGEAGKYISTVSLDIDHVTDPAKLQRQNVIFLDESVIEGAPYFTFTWFLKDTGELQTTHTHTFDEHIGFVGNDPDDPTNLHATLRIYIDGEWYETDRSCVVFLPAGTEHCPYELKNVTAPVAHWSAGAAGKYAQ